MALIYTPLVPFRVQLQCDACQAFMVYVPPTYTVVQGVKPKSYLHKCACGATKDMPQIYPTIEYRDV